MAYSETPTERTAMSFRPINTPSRPVEAPVCSHGSTEIIQTRYPTFEQLSRVLVLFGAAYAAKTLLDTSKDIAVLTAEAKIR